MLCSFRSFLDGGKELVAAGGDGFFGRRGEGEFAAPFVGRFVKLRIGADLDVGVFVLRGFHQVGEKRLAYGRKIFKSHDASFRKFGFDHVEHLAHQFRDAWEDVDVFQNEAGGAGKFVKDEAAAFGEVGHHEPQIVDPFPVVAVEHGFGFLVPFKFGAEGYGHGFPGEVVRSSADAAAGEDYVVRFSVFVDGTHDGVHLIGDGYDAFQVNAALVKPGGDEVRVYVLGAAREDLVPYYDYRGGVICHNELLLKLICSFYPLQIKNTFANILFDKPRQISLNVFNYVGLSGAWKWQNNGAIFIKRLYFGNKALVLQSK